MNTEAMSEYDFVYMGEREGKGSIRLVKLGIIDNGVVVRDFLMKWSRDWKLKGIGVVYTGAKFSETQALGAAQAKYKGQWHNEAERLQWTAAHRAAIEEQDRIKFEKKHGKNDEIDRVLLPLRRLYSSMNYLSERAALERAIIMSLRKPIA